MKEIQELLSRQMTRKEFLRLFVVALVAMLGVNNFIAALRKSSKQTGKSIAGSKATKGFGTRKFGA